MTRAPAASAGSGGEAAAPAAEAVRAGAPAAGGRCIRVVQFVRRPDTAFSIERVYRDVRAALPPLVAVEVVANRFASRGVLPRLRDAWRARRHAGEVNHVTGDVHYLTFFLPRARTVLTIHDTDFVDRARGLKRLALWLLWLWLPERRCGSIVAVSAETKRRLLEHLRCDPAKIAVIGNPVSPEFRPVPLPARDGVFRFLHIGTKPNKNLGRVIEALAGLPVELTILGPLSEAQRALLARHRVAHRNLSGLSDEAVRAAYAAAHALVFVSTGEGFGLPILEAQAVGRPVITSARAPMDEIAGDGALLVDPEDVGAIRRACMRLIEEDGLAAALVAAGTRNVARHEAAAVARAYAAHYAAVAARAEGRARGWRAARQSG